MPRAQRRRDDTDDPRPTRPSARGPNRRAVSGWGRREGIEIPGRAFPGRACGCAWAGRVRDGRVRDGRVRAGSCSDSLTRRASRRGSKKRPGCSDSLTRRASQRGSKEEARSGSIQSLLPCETSSQGPLRWRRTFPASNLCSPAKQVRRGRSGGGGPSQHPIFAPLRNQFAGAAGLSDRRNKNAARHKRSSRQPSNRRLSAQIARRLIPEDASLDRSHATRRHHGNPQPVVCPPTSTSI